MVNFIAAWLKSIEKKITWLYEHNNRDLGEGYPQSM